MDRLPAGFGLPPTLRNMTMVMTMVGSVPPA